MGQGAGPEAPSLAGLQCLRKKLTTASHPCLCSVSLLLAKTRKQHYAATLAVTPSQERLGTARWSGAAPTLGFRAGYRFPGGQVIPGFTASTALPAQAQPFLK